MSDRSLLALFLAAIAASLTAAHAADSGNQIVVNTVSLTAETVKALQTI